MTALEPGKDSLRLHPETNVGSRETRDVNSEFDSRVSVRPSNDSLVSYILLFITQLSPENLLCQ